MARTSALILMAAAAVAFRSPASRPVLRVRLGSAATDGVTGTKFEEEDEKKKESEPGIDDEVQGDQGLTRARRPITPGR